MYLNAPFIVLSVCSALCRGVIFPEASSNVTWSTHTDVQSATILTTRVMDSHSQQSLSAELSKRHVDCTTFTEAAKASRTKTPSNNDALTAMVAFQVRTLTIYMLSQIQRLPHASPTNNVMATSTSYALTSSKHPFPDAENWTIPSRNKSSAATACRSSTLPTKVPDLAQTTSLQRADQQSCLSCSITDSNQTIVAQSPVSYHYQNVTRGGTATSTTDQPSTTASNKARSHSTQWQQTIFTIVGVCAAHAIIVMLLA
jgi:hypothetical protein